MRTGGVVPVVFWLDGFEEPFDAVGGESAVSPVPDEQHVVPGEPELAVGVLGKRLVGGPAKGSGDSAGHDGGAGVVHEPLPGGRVQPGPEGPDVNSRAGAGTGTRAVFRGVHVTRA